MSDDQTRLKSGWDEAYQESGTASLWQEAPIPILDDLIKLLGSHSVKTVVDLGCGDGRNLVPLASHFNVVGVDLSQVALQRAAKKLCDKSAIYIVGDIERLPFASSTVEAVSCLDVFGQLPVPSKVVDEIFRILKPGGILALNAFTLQDETYGVGDPIPGQPHSFNYKNTLFHYFTKDEVLSLFSSDKHKWKTLQFSTKSWDDPPHGDFRPVPHKHDNWILVVQKPS